jgi:competence protein ComEC
MSLSKSKIFLIFCIAFIFGIFLGKYLNLEVMAFVAVIFLILATVFWENKIPRLIGLAGLVLLLGSLRFYLGVQTPDLTPYFGRQVEIAGTIAEEPDQRESKTFLTLEKIEVNGKPSRDRILVTVPRFPGFEYGDRLKFKEKLVEPKDAEAKGEFSYKNYLSRFGVTALVYYPKIEKIGAGEGNVIKTVLLRAKGEFIGRISKLLPEPQNSFLAGLLVGLRRGIPEDLMDYFNATSTTHIIAISGFNITIIAGALNQLLERFGKRVSFIISLLSIALFVVLTGASASVVRAGVMGALGLIALNVGRVYAVTNALAFTAVLMLGFNPKILHFDVGFQLSFLALAGLIYLSPRIEPYFSRLPGTIRKYLVPTLAAQIFTLPVLLYNFDRLSLVSPVANLLVLPVIPLTMGLGFFAGILGLIWDKLALPLVWATWLLLSYVIKVVAVLSGLPFASLTIENVPIVFVIVYYVLLLGLLTFWKYREIIINYFGKWKTRPSPFSNT